MTQKVFKLKPLQRRAVCDPIYIKKLDKTVEFSLGVPEDKDVLLDYYEAVVYPLKPLDVALGLLPKFLICMNFLLDMGAKLFRDHHVEQIEEWLSGPFMVLAHCDLELCGLVNGVTEKLDIGKRRPLKFEEDYGKSEFFDVETVHFVPC
jgi:hypothetical protein